jgi:hypothetical protein
MVASGSRPPGSGISGAISLRRNLWRGAEVPAPGGTQRWRAPQTACALADISDNSMSYVERPPAALGWLEPRRLLIEHMGADREVRQCSTASDFRRRQGARRHRARDRTASATDHPRRPDCRARRVGAGGRAQSAEDLKDTLGMSYLFVSHDLNVVRLLRVGASRRLFGAAIRISRRSPWRSTCRRSSPK